MIQKQIDDIDITNLTSNDIDNVKDALHTNLIVVLKHQSTNPWYYTNFIERIGEIANYNQFMWTTDGEMVIPQEKLLTESWTGSKDKYPIQRVTGMKKNNRPTGIFGEGILDWHANLNGIDRADGVVLQAWDEHCINTSTSFLNTNLAYNDLDPDFKQELEHVYCEYEYTPEVWAKGLPEGQLRIMKQKESHYKMWLFQENLKGVKGIFFYTNNKCKIVTEDDTLYQRLYDHMFQEKYIYQHWWEPGDIVLMDQILTLHKRDQNDPDILAKRILHRITFRISNYNGWLQDRNLIYKSIH